MSDKHYTHPHDQTQLEMALRSTKPFFERYGTTIIYAVAAVLAIAAIAVYLQRQPPENANASRELLAATFPSAAGDAAQPEMFRDVADNFPGTEIATWARLRQADRLLDDAISNMFTDRKIALEGLDNAEAAYKRLADRGDIDESIRERVLIGQARLTETRCDGSEKSKKAAVDAWQNLLTQFEGSMLKEHAENRIERLGTKSTQDFYAWFHEQNPEPGDDLQLPDDGQMPGGGPGLVPDIPNIPGFPPITLPSDEELETSDDATSDDATSDVKQAEESTTGEPDEKSTSDADPPNVEGDQAPTNDETADDEAKSDVDPGTPEADAAVPAAETPAAAEPEPAVDEEPPADEPESAKEAPADE